MQLKSSLLFVAGSLLLAVQTEAQSATRIYYPDNVVASGSCNVIPLGHVPNATTWQNQKYHMVVPSSTFGNKVGAITELGFAACRGGVMDYKTIQVRLDYFQGQGTTMSTTFANNISSKAVTVLNATNYRFNTASGKWMRIGLQKPFLYLPQLGHLLVEVTVNGAGGTGYSFRTGSTPRLYAIGFAGTPPTAGTLGSSAALKIEIGFDAASLEVYGHGCTGSNNMVPTMALGGSAVLGQSLSISVGNALSKAPMYLLIGLNQLPTPFEMVAWGAPGCRLQISSEIITVQVADANGNYTGKFGVPNTSSMVGTKVYTQAFPFDFKANTFGTTASPYGRILVGR